MNSGEVRLPPRGTPTDRIGITIVKNGKKYEINLEVPSKALPAMWELARDEMVSELNGLIDRDAIKTGG